MTLTDRRSGYSEGLSVKRPCVVATTTNVTLSGLQTIDGVLLVSGDRVLVKSQTNGVNNGIYDVSSGNWTRSVDCDGSGDVVSGTAIHVNGGLTATDFFFLTTANPITIGTTSLTFTAGDANSVINNRVRLTANSTFYVGGDGLDSHSPLPNVNTAANAKLTWNSLYTYVTSTYDFAGFTVTLKSRTTNTYGAGLFMSVAWVGGGQLVIDLNGCSIAETVTKGIINDVVQPGQITIQNSAGLGVGGVVSSSGFAGIQNDQPSDMNIGVGITVGTSFDAAFEATQGAGIYLASPVYISGTGGGSLALAALGGIIGFNGQTVTFVGNKAYTNGTVVVTSGGKVACDAVTWQTNPGGALGGPYTVTGPRFSTSLGGSIYTAGAGDTFIPGTTVGVYASGGIYDGNMGINKITGIGTIQAPFPLIFQTNGATNAGIITAAQRWGFGNTTGALTPTNTQVVISQNVTAVDAATPGLTPVLHIVGADTTIGTLVLDGFANVPGIAFRRAQGTAASRTVVTSGQPIGSFFGLGYDASGSLYGYGAEIDMVATETWSATAHGCGFKFYSVVNTTITQVNSMTLQSSGCLTIGSGGSDAGAGNITATGAISPGSFTVAGLPAGTVRMMAYCSNARMWNGAGVQEGAGVGTGGHVTYNGTAWKVAGTNTTAIA